jgi:hypothetical protein
MDLDLKNELHSKYKERLLILLTDPQMIQIGGEATRFMAIIPTTERLTKAMLIDSILDFIHKGKTLKMERMYWGDLAFIFKHVRVEPVDIYVEVQFAENRDGEEILRIFSVHENREWSK